MYLFVEIWNAKPAWLALSQEERGAYMQGVAGAMGDLMAAGIEIVGWSKLEPDTPHASNYRYFAAWKMPSKEAVSLFETTVAGAGWYDYFEQENLRGELHNPPDPVIGDLISL